MENEKAEALALQANELAVNAGNYKIETNEALGEAAEILKQVKSKYTELDELRKTMTKPLDESKKKIMEFFRIPLEKLTSAETMIKNGIVNFKHEQQRKRQEEIIRQQRELEAQARKLEAEAKAAEKAGQTEKVAELQKEKIEIQQEKKDVAIMVPPPDVKKIEGLSFRKVWKFKITDPAALPREYMMPNEAMLKSTATSLKEKARVPGVEFYFEEIAGSGR